MGSAHQHEHIHDTDTYYLDQLCMVGMTGAFAGICLTLYFVQRDPATQTGMLYTLLQEQFHPMILAAGIALLVVTLVRAAILWQAAGAKPAGHVHTHDHDHHHHEGEAEGDCCGHDHHHDEHVHAGAPSPALPSLPTVPHAHDHSHSHGPDDGHDHSWAPWRYVVLLIPLMLYLLGLPSKAMPLTAAGKLDTRQESITASQLVGLGVTPLTQLAFGAAVTLHTDNLVAPVFIDNEQVTVAKLQPGMPVWLKLVADPKVQGHQGVASVWAAKESASPSLPPSQDRQWTPMGSVKEVNTKENTLTVSMPGASPPEKTFDLEGTVFIDYKQLEQLAFDTKSRADYDKKKVQVIGQFVPYRGTDNVFSLSRLRIQCCAADAVQLNVPIYAREGVKGFKPGDWVRVTGRIEFREQPGRPGIFGTVLVVNRRENVVSTEAGSTYLN